MSTVPFLSLRNLAALATVLLIGALLIGLSRPALAQPVPDRYVLMDGGGNRVVIFCSASKADGQVAAQKLCATHREALLKVGYKDVRSPSDYAPTAAVWTSNCYVDYRWIKGQLLTTTDCAGTEARAMDQRIRSALGLK